MNEIEVYIRSRKDLELKSGTNIMFATSYYILPV